MAGKQEDNSGVQQRGCKNVGLQRSEFACLAFA
jgi:hypothetical protein